VKEEGHRRYNQFRFQSWNEGRRSLKSFPGSESLPGVNVIIDDVVTILESSPELGWEIHENLPDLNPSLRGLFAEGPAGILSIEIWAADSSIMLMIENSTTLEYDVGEAARSEVFHAVLLALFVGGATCRVGRWSAVCLGVDPVTLASSERKVSRESVEILHSWGRLAPSSLIDVSALERLNFIARI
jgi:hypothetical protein